MIKKYKSECRHYFSFKVITICIDLRTLVLFEHSNITSFEFVGILTQGCKMIKKCVWILSLKNRQHSKSKKKNNAIRLQFNYQSASETSPDPLKHLYPSLRKTS